MNNLKKIEENHIKYADTIEEIIAQPRTNEQLVSLCESVVRYLRISGNEIAEYNKQIKAFIGAMYKLP